MTFELQHDNGKPAFLPELSESPRGKREAMSLSLDQIHIDNKENTRSEMLSSAVVALAESMGKFGQISPVIVRPSREADHCSKPYILVAGYTRCAAARTVLKWDMIDVIVQDLSPMEAIYINIEENVQRTQLNIMDEAKAISRLVRIGQTKREIAARLGKSLSWVHPRHALLQMSEQIQLMAREGYLTESQIRQLAALSDKEAQLELAREIRRRRESGYTGEIKVRAPETPTQRKQRTLIGHVRSKRDIEALLLHLVDHGVPAGLHTRTLAWAAGNVSDSELASDLVEYAAGEGVQYFPSPEGFPAGDDDLYVKLRKQATT